MLIWEARQLEHEALARSAGLWPTPTPGAKEKACDTHVFVGDTCKGCGLKGVQISVNGEARIVAPPPAGCYYDSSGRLQDPRARRGVCEHPFDMLTPQSGGGMRCTLCGAGGIY